MNRRLRDTLALILLLSASGAFGSMILATSAPVSLPKHESAFPEVAGARPFVLPEVAPTSLDQLGTALQRPLFVRSRRPPAPRAPAQATLDAKLVGILSNGAKKTAIILAENAGQFARLGEGQSFQGWRVVRIEDYSVAFQHGERTARLELVFTSSSELPPEAAPLPEIELRQPPSRATGAFFVTDECGLTQCQGEGRQQR